MECVAFMNIYTREVRGDLMEIQDESEIADFAKDKPSDCILVFGDRDEIEKLEEGDDGMGEDSEFDD